MNNLVHFGLVTSLVIAIALVADLILSPVLLSMAYEEILAPRVPCRVGASKLVFSVRV